jgi:hypothetical protein
LCEDDLPINNDKIIKIPLGNVKKPTFKSLFSLFKDNNINIIANTDIYFDSSLSIAKAIKHNEVYCLNRREPIGITKFRIFKRNIGNAQDAWIFKGRVSDSVIQSTNFPLGTPGCDNHLAWVLHNNGYNLLNPSYFIRAIHLHKSNYRNYSKDDRIEGEYLYIKPTFKFKFSIREKFTYLMNILYEKCTR